MSNTWKTLIVDDEKPARERLRRLLGKYDDRFEIIEEAADSFDAAKKIELLLPELVFLDIQMPGPNVFEMLTGLNHKPAIVFCTAYDSYAMEAFNTFSVDYLLKPVEKERLDLTLKKLERMNASALPGLYRTIENIVIQKPVPVTITHKLGNKIIPVKLDEVVYFEANDKYVNFFNSAGTTYFTDQTLAVLSQKLPEKFIRISKSDIINVDFILEIQKYFRGRFVFVMNDKARTKLVSGQTYSEGIKEKFEI
ncbi:Transcriptional regulatory protein BtsR [bioreactor metagenome]|uniref:Transcriptional regulatory protein BtsR n=1 Tax=bioreactor metagenome TaxID=1076179 RepID=A0A644YN48_9ZZZZ